MKTIKKLSIVLLMSAAIIPSVIAADVVTESDKIYSQLQNDKNNQAKIIETKSYISSFKYNLGLAYSYSKDQILNGYNIASSNLFQDWSAGKLGKAKAATKVVGAAAVVAGLGYGSYKAYNYLFGKKVEASKPVKKAPKTQKFVDKNAKLKKNINNKIDKLENQYKAIMAGGCCGNTRRTNSLKKQINDLQAELSKLS